MRSRPAARIRNRKQHNSSARAPSVSLAPSMPVPRRGNSTENVRGWGRFAGCATELIRAGRGGDSVPCWRTPSVMEVQCKLMNTLDIFNDLTWRMRTVARLFAPSTEPSSDPAFRFEFPAARRAGSQTKSPGPDSMYSRGKSRPKKS
jgi:hypothetical protein